MNYHRVLTIIDKEWAEIFKNRLVLFTVAFLPFIFTVLPLVILYLLPGEAANNELEEMPPQFLALCGEAAAIECLQIYTLQQFLLLFMLMPLIIPVSIAAYSIVGEKTTRSLEPLLATPITTEELLAGKGLAAAVPAVLATWVGFTVFALAAPLAGAGPAALRALTSPTWLLAIFVLGPLMAVVAVNFAIYVSSRASDPRTAEQAAAIIIVPVLLALFGQIGGLLVLNATFMLVAAIVLLAVDVGMLYLGARLFERETILTRWR